MTTRFHSLKGIAALGLVVLTCAGLVSCGGGGGSGPVSVGGGSRSSGDQMLIVPPSPNVAPTPNVQPTPNVPPSPNVPEAQGHPDLVVGTPTVSDSGPETGASFTLSATVSNTGDGESPATPLQYYRSTDATITTSDTSVGTGAVAALAASGNASASVELTAPSSGTYYYGACVDAVTGESDTTNNCSTSVEVTVLETEQQTQGHPDLAVGTPTVSDNGPAAGANFTLSATVSNTGDGESPATPLRYYRSRDATITTSDTEVRREAVAALAASGNASASVELTAPSISGTYYYGACVDAVTDESDTTNNCSASVPVTVCAGGEPATEVHLFRPDTVEEGATAAPLVVVAWTSGACPPTVSIPVRVWLVEGTAKEGVDFAPLSQSVEFNPSDFTFNGSRYENLVPFPITILDDTEAEGDETFGGTMMLEGALPFVTLSPNAPDQLSITILANDDAG